MKPNPGHLPAEAMGKRVNVRLANGSLRTGWPADGRGACRWTIEHSPFDIAEYEVAA
ncbi:hypothetical protein [Sphingomonas hengshuiensis]|uniref:hypothetical protein n=1 Tax=Sphingomonas hengshuiensis TaxID=1609977 RepID=UPI000A896D95|nr:hypothetical protein [Sphingomonas hengshuiensis]